MINKKIHGGMVDMAAEQMDIPFVDAHRQNCITDEQAQFFLDNGFLVVRHVLQGTELSAVQRDMQTLFDKGMAGVTDDPDFAYGKGAKSGKAAFRRVEYVIDKYDVMKSLLGHPFILNSVEKLQGRNFIPTWDSMVVKIPDEGVIVPWHRDSGIIKGNTDPRPIFNVDFYLDEADLKSCLWVIPGSNKWSTEQANERCSQPGFDTSDAIPVPMQPGDVIFHDILVLHGSPDGDGNAQRRTVYYEFRPGEVEANLGPHTLEYLVYKQHMLIDCIERRKMTPYGAKESPFTYRPDGKFAIAAPRKPDTYRYPHRTFFIKAQS